MSEAQPEHILIVDQDHATRNQLGALLQRQRYRVSGAASAHAALAAIEQDRPDLLVIDRHLPDMTGEALLDYLRNTAHTRHLPIVMLSDDGARALFRASMNLGADDFLLKPVEPRELVDAVAMQLRKQRQRRGARLGGALAELAPGVPPAYRVTGIIAKGGSATAYLARHDERGEDCVVKVLDATDPELIAGFAREGALLKRIAHANVVRMHEYGQWQGRHYMALEYVAGGTLKQLMGAPWQGAEAMRVILKVARGLSAVHAAGVVHRDIKPDNILLRFNSLEPVLLDFGTATEQDAPAQAGAILGTPSYMAPEVIGGKAALPASDVYACGVMLYELLTGAKPYAAADVTALLALHLEAPVPRLPERDAVFQPLLDRMLAKDPQQRLRDGTEMAAALVKLWHRVKRG